MGVPGARRARLALALAGLGLGACPGAAWAAIDVRLRGTLPPAVEANIRAHLSIVEEAKNPDLTEEQVERLHNRADKEIRAALQPLGYYNPQLRLNLSGQPPDWVAAYDISIGPRTALDEVKTEVEGPGKDNETILAAEDRLGIKAGDLLDHRNYEAAKAGWLSTAIGAGYLDAAYSVHQLRIDTAENSAAAWLTMDTGIRYYFGPVILTDEEPLAEDFLRRYVRFHEGEPFDPTKVEATRFAFTDLDQFDSIDVVADKADGQQDGADPGKTPDGRIPVEYRFRLKPSRRYSAGVGYGTDTGARVSGLYEWRRLNPYGHRALVNARISQIRSDLIGEYRIPIGTKPEERVSFIARAATDQINDQKITLGSVGTFITRVPGLWRRLYYTDYQVEHNDTTPPRDSRVWVFGATINRGVYDDATFTRLGFSLLADVHGAPKPLLSTTSFLQERVVLKGAIPLFERARLLGRAELGYTQVKDYDTLPTLQRFYAGGDQSVRGYGYRSIGRRDAAGRNIGGAYLAVYSVEGEYFLKDNIGAAVFVDAGGADNKANPRLSVGAGVGARYKAPFGVFRVDVAHPFDRTQSTSAVRLHLGVSIGL